MFLSPSKNKKAKIYQDAMRDAVINGHADMVDDLLAKGAVAEGFCPPGPPRDRGATTFLARAAEDGNLRIVNALLAHGASIDMALNLAGDKFKHNYDLYAFHIKNGYIDSERKSAIQEAFQFDRYQKEFFVNYSLKPEVDHILDHLNDMLRELSDLSEDKKNAIANYLQTIFKRYSIQASDNDIQNNLNSLIETLKALDKKTEEFKNKATLLEENYERMLEILLDRAAGLDVSIERKKSFGFSYFGGLSFLAVKKNHNNKKTCLNFIGVSIAGRPITREMLSERGFQNVDDALLSVDDLVKLENSERREAITASLESAYQKYGKLINETGIVNIVPLARAAKVGDIHAVETRLNAGVDPNAQYEDYYSIVLDNGYKQPIVLAAKGGHEQVVKLLASHPKIDPTSIVTAIEVARSAGHDALSDYLFSYKNIDATDKKGNTLLHKAVEKCDLKQALSLINKGANVNLFNNEGDTPLAIAVKYSGTRWLPKESEGNLKMIKLLLDHHADANLFYSNSPLYEAFFNGSSRAATLLLPFTKKTNANDAWFVDLMFICIRHDECIQLLSLLKSHGADFNQTRNWSDNTLLNEVLASLPSYSDIKRTMFDLIQGGYGENKERRQKIMEELQQKSQAMFQKRMNVINFLLDNGASLRLADKTGTTPIQFLIKEVDLSYLEDRYKEILEKFVKLDPEIINQIDKDGMTPLHWAAEKGDLIACKFLIKSGASIHALNHNKETALHLAEKKGNTETARFLVESGAERSNSEIQEYNTAKKFGM